MQLNVQISRSTLSPLASVHYRLHKMFEMSIKLNNEKAVFPLSGVMLRKGEELPAISLSFCEDGWFLASRGCTKPVRKNRQQHHRSQYYVFQSHFTFIFASSPCSAFPVVSLLYKSLCLRVPTASGRPRSYISLLFRI